MRFLNSLLRRKTQILDTELLLPDLISHDGPQTGIPPSIATSGDKATHQEVVPFSTPKPTGKLSGGWRFNVILSIILGASILILNFGVTIWASTKFSRDKDVATVYEGSCSKVKTTITCINIGVNILGTLLLGASNVCMQILCAPTRKEIDRAHAINKWLGIGIPSLKNLFYVDRKKSALWVLLGLSSIPLHLLWNSAFVNSLSSNSYVATAVTEGFLNGDFDYNAIQDTLELDFSVVQNMLDNFRNQSLVSLEVTDCMAAYGQEFVSKYGDLFMVYEGGSDYSLPLAQTKSCGANMGGISRWMCGIPCANEGRCGLANLLRKNATNWTPFGYDHQGILHGNMKYCLAEKLDSPCRIGVSIPIMITVLSCNIIKIACFITTLLVDGAMLPLVTNGDAIQSFLIRPDINLQGRCLVSRDDVYKEHFWSEQPLPCPWRSKRRAWIVGASKSSWLATFIPGIILIITIIVVCVSNHVWSGGSAALVSSGFGKPSVNQLVSTWGGSFSPPAASLFANTPQILVSYIYLAYNGVFTSMLATAEWADYSVRRRGLRVAWPRGQQRATNFLSLPYTYAVPIMAASTMLHWLISESLFAVRITNFHHDGSENKQGLISAVAYSSFAAVFALSMGGAMLVAVLLVGLLKKYPATIPLAACCSATIAALCQPADNMAKDVMTLKELQWGVVDQTLRNDDHGDVEHACFSAGEVTPLVPGRIYA